MIDELEHVILVDPDDQPLGTERKIEAHVEGKLHRAFSVLIHDGNGRMLLQQRAPEKYHSGGLWTNACCGHPRPGEATIDAARRRLIEEMGIDCPLVPLHSLTYRADVGNGLIEHEVVHLFVGHWDGAVAADPSEVSDYAWKTLNETRAEALNDPERFTAWFRVYLDRQDTDWFAA
ncbi:Isopentenyl-diphosphate delta-isomerase [Hyphomicrobium sulfonivorans]|uniref:Isopentenyl-diphosphate Delta-isomerase n=1 Tax=Hyphomicrobium sulfonivorans TaxID=121290 RepID=A0A125NU13_HYPSL|nr:isopentenyl-diphosphate Delta-isomerase [Hyphomicrobium sulfonivorans]KWT65205.1 Isopentenyl-diphosphate delta-isomerase [Hyphomicrobium sulfonivorans]